MKISTLLLACLFFLVMLTGALTITTEFFNVGGTDPFNSSTFDVSYLTKLENSSLKSGTGAGKFVETTSGMSMELFEEESGVGEATPEQSTFRRALKSINMLNSLTDFVKITFTDVTSKLGIPSYFLIAFVLMVIIIITVQAIALLRGVV